MTERPQNKNLKPIQPGEVRNPNGRPKGSRNKLGEKFIEDVFADWELHGAATIVKVRETEPAQYVKVVAGILPKEFKITDESDLSDEEVLKQLRQLDALIRPFLGAEGTSGSDEGAPAPSITH